ncbi:MAG: ABC transporter ATP-binding protein [Candidatus Methanomethylicaceae archaeon]
MVEVEVEHISFGYGNGIVLQDVNLTASEGEILCILGPNGAGKSTLVKIMAGILKPQSGRVLLNGEDIGRLSMQSLSRIVGYVPQGMKTVFSTTVFESILTARLPYINWSPSKTDLKKTEEVIKKLNLGRLAFRYTNEISGGEWQKVMLAMALVKEPSLLLLDEPTSNLDLKHQVEVMNLIRDLAKNEKMTVVATTHDINLASKYADTIALMKDGKIYGIDKPFCILNERTIKEVYGVEVEVIRCNSLFISPI